MQKDYKLAYWIESLECSLDSIGCLDKLTKPQIEQVAGDLEVSAENQGIAFGHDAIPNPLNQEIRELKSKHEKEIDELEKREKIYRDFLAFEYNVEPCHIIIHNNKLEVITN